MAKKIINKDVVVKTFKISEIKAVAKGEQEANYEDMIGMLQQMDVYIKELNDRRDSLAEAIGKVPLQDVIQDLLARGVISDETEVPRFIVKNNQGTDIAYTLHEKKKESFSLDKKNFLTEPVDKIEEYTFIPTEREINVKAVKQAYADGTLAPELCAYVTTTPSVTVTTLQQDKSFKPAPADHIEII